MLHSHKILIEKDGKYLVLLRTDKCKRYAEHWDLPGGKAEENEDYDETIRREVREEIGAEVLIGDKIFSFEIESECVRGVRVGFNLYDGVLQNPTAEIKLNPEHTEYAWLTLAELQNLEKREIVLDNYLRSLKK